MKNSIFSENSVGENSVGQKSIGQMYQSLLFLNMAPIDRPISEIEYFSQFFLFAHEH
jgi:hypothetical protein